MSKFNSKNIRKWLRILHRDLGYFFVGITIVYGISGIILNHKKQGQDPAFKTIVVEKQFPQLLTIEEFKSQFESQLGNYELKKVLPNNTNYQLFLQGGVGYYNLESGRCSFELYQKKPFVFFINKLHYNQKNYWTAIADIFAGVMIFFALSGLFMVKGKNGIMRKGKWYVLAGILIILIYLIT